MKKLIYITFIAVLAFSCQNQDVDFPDFEYTAVYFPLQYPVRTLVLGESRIDNTNDLQLKFLIGASVGGMYKNDKTWTVNIAQDNSLVDSLLTAQGDTLRVLPAEYYSLSSDSEIVIPSGEFDGVIEVQLSEAFLDDPMAFGNNYVIPLRITDSNADSVLTGLPAVQNPNKNIAADWDPNALPRDFVLFGIKYINAFHGDYFHRGADITTYNDNEINETVYTDKYVEKSQIMKLKTAGKNVSISNGIGQLLADDGSIAMKLIVSDDGTVKVDSVETSTFKTYGSGRFEAAGGTWGGESHGALFLKYQYVENDTLLHTVTDTLIFRNNGVVFEENRVSKY